VLQACYVVWFGILFAPHIVAGLAEHA